MGFKSWTTFSVGALALTGGLALSAIVIPGSASNAESAGQAPTLSPIAVTPSAARAAAPMEAAQAPMAAPPSAQIEGVPQQLLARALVSLETHRAGLANTSRIGIADFSAHSSMPRFYIVDLDRRTATAVRVTHGSGSDANHDGYLDRFSDADGSNATSRGAYRTAEVYDGQYGRAERLDGLDASNRTARDRAIVMHHAWYAEPDVVASQKKLGRSQGCFTFSSADLPTVMAALPPGSLIYADAV